MAVAPGTPAGEIFDMPPTGRSFTMEQIQVVRIVEHWAVRDDLGMMRQLGLMPER